MLCCDIVLILKGDGKIADLLLIAGADYNCVDNDYWTPLHFTAQNSKFVKNSTSKTIFNVGICLSDTKNIAIKLIRRGADVDALDTDDNSPLNVAAYNG